MKLLLVIFFTLSFWRDKAKEPDSMFIDLKGEEKRMGTCKFRSNILAKIKINLTDLVANETQTKNEANANMTTSDTKQKMFQKVAKQVRTEVQDISRETAGKSREIKT